MNFLTSINTYSKAFNTPITAQSLISSAFYNFILSSNLNNTGTGSQTLTASGTTFTTYSPRTAIYINSDGVASGDKLQTNTGAILPNSIGSSATVSFWIYPVSYNGNQFNPVFWYNAKVGSSNVARFTLQNNRGGNYVFIMGSPDNGSSENFFEFNLINAPLNTWTHIAFTWTINASRIATVRIYANATQIGTLTVNNWADFETLNTNSGLFCFAVEHTTQSLTGQTPQSMRLAVQRFAYWNNRELTPTELQLIMTLN